MIDSKEQDPVFSIEKSREIIRNTYAHFGTEIATEFFDVSMLEPELGKIQNHWNAGLFRFLDEAIYLFSILDLFTTGFPWLKKELAALTVLTHQIKSNAIAIRILGSHGLDASAMTNLRTLYEMCIAFCRALIDNEFQQGFINACTTKDANEFWHRFIKNSKSEKFLRNYNKSTDRKCLLVEADAFTPYESVLGVGAHPNFILWMLDRKLTPEEVSSGENSFRRSSANASSLLLILTADLLLLTSAFAANSIAKETPELGYLMGNPLFEHHASDKEALKAVGGISSFLFLLLHKWNNQLVID